jgi:hypothetical protein
VDESGRDSQRRMMDLIVDMQVDVVGLLETDRKCDMLIKTDTSTPVRVWQQGSNKDYRRGVGICKGVYGIWADGSMSTLVLVRTSIPGVARSSPRSVQSQYES